MKYSQWIGILAALVLIGSCFLPWTYHPDLNKHFTGFFSENNVYGRPGKVFMVLCAAAIVFYAVPRVWAKRWNLLITAITTAFALKSFIMFSGCYRGVCPDKQAGIWIMMMAAVAMLVMACLPDVKLNKPTK
jgi:hypothetical protein